VSVDAGALPALLSEMVDVVAASGDGGPVDLGGELNFAHLERGLAMASTGTHHWVPSRSAARTNRWDAPVAMASEAGGLLSMMVTKSSWPSAGATGKSPQRPR
jgi:hypothetical protein